MACASDPRLQAVPITIRVDRGLRLLPEYPEGGQMSGAPVALFADTCTSTDLMRISTSPYHESAGQSLAFLCTSETTSYAILSDRAKKRVFSSSHNLGVSMSLRIILVMLGVFTYGIAHADHDRSEFLDVGDWLEAERQRRAHLAGRRKDRLHASIHR